MLLQSNIFLLPCPRCEKPNAVECHTPDWPQPPVCKDCIRNLAYEGRYWCSQCQIAVEEPDEDGSEVQCACC